MGTRTLPKVLRTTLDIGGPGRPWKRFTMRPRFSLLIALAALLLAPALASAQSDVVCVHTDASDPTRSTVPSDNDSPVQRRPARSHDCVLGPDGSLYVANDNNILRMNPDGKTSQLDGRVNGRRSTVGGREALAFNVTTLYINTGRAQACRTDGRHRADVTDIRA